MSVQSEEKWSVEISPRNHVFDIDLKELWHYRDLLWILVRRDFVSFYKQTILGPLWFFIQPLFTTVIFTFVFGKMAGLSTDGLPQPLFYMSGIIAWNYFAECITKTSTVFKDNANIFGKVYFPRLIMPLSLVVSNLVRFAVQLILLLLTMGWFYWVRGVHNFHFTSYFFLFPYIVLLMALLGLGLGMIISALTTKYRDLAFLVTFGVQLLMYMTTVPYPLSEALQKFSSFKWVVLLNPMTPIIELFRRGFLGSGNVSWGLLGYASGITFLILAIGIVIFNRVEKSFVDTV